MIGAIVPWFYTLIFSFCYLLLTSSHISVTFLQLAKQPTVCRCVFTNLLAHSPSVIHHRHELTCRQPAHCHNGLSLCLVYWVGDWLMVFYCIFCWPVAYSDSLLRLCILWMFFGLAYLYDLWALKHSPHSVPLISVPFIIPARPWQGAQSTWRQNE